MNNLDKHDRVAELEAQIAKKDEIILEAYQAINDLNIKILTNKKEHLALIAKLNADFFDFR